jgi:ComF family protein
VGKTQALRDGIDAVLAVAFGASCAACGQLLEHPSRGPVCDDCWSSIAGLPPPAFQISTVIDRAQAIGPHDAALRSIVHALKYEGRRSLATPLASLMLDRCRWALEDAEVAVPVPLHPSRRRQRGFNQALDLSRGLRLPVCHALRRVRATPSQTDLTAAERHENLRNAFAASRLPWRVRAVAGRIVVLVDDVSTTGATLDECARVIQEVGAREVRAVTAARAAMSRR